MNDTSSSERVGVLRCGEVFELNSWAFREQQPNDYGIDAQAEPKIGGAPTGRQAGLQIKAGPSYFDELNGEDGWWYRGSPRHLRYWLGHGLPVFIIIHDIESRTSYWQHVTSTLVTTTPSGWKIPVPKANVLGPDTLPSLREIVMRAPGANEDLLETNLALLPPTVASVLRQPSGVESHLVLHLAQRLAAGRAEPRFTIETILASNSGWLAKGSGQFEVVLGMYANEHQHRDLAYAALSLATGYPSADARLFAHTALAALQVGDISAAQDLVTRAEQAGGGLLTDLTAVQVEGAISGSPADPSSAVRAATPAELAAEPACLTFLGEWELGQRNWDAAINYLRASREASPESSGVALLLSQALMFRVTDGRSAVPAQDVRLAEALSREALEQRRLWAGPSEEALAVLLRIVLFNGAFHELLDLSLPDPDGGALPREAAAPEVMIIGAEAAVATGRRDLIDGIVARSAGTNAQATVHALAMDADAPATAHIAAWQEVIATDPPPEWRLRALYRLAGFGALPPNDLDLLQGEGTVDEIHAAAIRALDAGANGDAIAAAASLRRYAASPIASEVALEILENAELYEEALAECERAAQRFGFGVLAHKHFNLLVRTERTGATEQHALQMLASTDTPREVRRSLRRRLVALHMLNSAWSAAADQCRAAVDENFDDSYFTWALIACQLRQRGMRNAWSFYQQQQPTVECPSDAAVWLHLHASFGFDLQEVQDALDWMDRWPEADQYAAQLLAIFLASSGQLTLDGAPLLPTFSPELLDRFRAALASYIAAHPDGPLQMVTGTPEEIATLLRAQLEPLAMNATAIVKAVRDGQVPYGMLAEVTQRPFTQALIQRAGGFLPAVTSDLAAFAREIVAAEAALGRTVAVDLSALAVATLLPDTWPSLFQAFHEIQLPRDATHDHAATHSTLDRDPGTWYTIAFDPHDQTLRHDSLTAEQHTYLSGHLSAIDQAMESLTIAETPDHRVFEEGEPGHNSIWMSPLALAHRDHLALWCDDAVVRILAHEAGVPAFGTVALLHVLVEHNTIPDVLRESVHTLAAEFVVDFELTTEELQSLAEEGQWKVGPAATALSRPNFWATNSNAQNDFLGLIAEVHAHAPEEVVPWFTAACTGLAAAVATGRRAEELNGLFNGVADRLGVDETVYQALKLVAGSLASATS